MFDYITSRETADRLIQKFGMRASLRSNAGGALRDCWIVITEYMPKDAATQLANPTDRQVIIAAGLGAVPNNPPDWENDQLQTYVQPDGTAVNEILPFTMPVKPVSPAGTVVMYQTTVKR